MKKVVLIGEIRIATGCVHQQDFAAALNAERLIGWPKSVDDVQIVVGRLLAGRKPALLHKADKNGIATVTVDSLVTPEVRQRLIDVLKAKSALAPYEQLALANLQEAKPAGLDPAALGGTFPLPGKPKRGGSKKKAAANG